MKFEELVWGFTRMRTNIFGLVYIWYYLNLIPWETIAHCRTYHLLKSVIDSRFEFVRFVFFFLFPRLWVEFFLRILFADASCIEVVDRSIFLLLRLADVSSKEAPQETEAPNMRGPVLR